MVSLWPFTRRCEHGTCGQIRCARSIRHSYVCIVGNCRAHQRAQVRTEQRRRAGFPDAMMHCCCPRKPLAPRNKPLDAREYVAQLVRALATFTHYHLIRRRRGRLQAHRRASTQKQVNNAERPSFDGKVQWSPGQRCSTLEPRSDFCPRS